MSHRVSPWTRAILLISLIVALLVGGTTLWLTLDRRFYVYSADVKGAAIVSQEEVFGVSGLVGLHILWAGLDKYESRIVDELPAVKSAKIACGLPAHCKITVVEREPTFAWEEGGQLKWIDREGVIFPARGAGSDGSAVDAGVQGWLVRGPLPDEDEDGRLDKRVHVALSELWESEAEIPLELLYVPGRGLMFTDRHGWRIIVGQGTGMAERLQVLEQVTAHLESRGVTPRYVDVRFPEAPYYSVENEW